MTATLLYIAGSGHSGSTVLSIALGAHPKIVSLGEIHRLYLSAHKEESVHRCSCGERVVECLFWHAVAKEVGKRLDCPTDEALGRLVTTDRDFLKIEQKGQYLDRPSRPPRISSRANKLALVLGIPSAWRLLSGFEEGARRSRRAALDSLLLFEAVQAVTGAHVIIDSTKNPGRLKSLWFEAPDVFRVLHLIRDGRAVCWSRVHREGITMESAAKIWRKEHYRQAAVMRSIPPSRIKSVHYEDLCTAPSEVLRNLCRWLELPFAEDMLSLSAKQQHMVGGNPVRFNGNTTQFYPDDRWRAEMPEGTKQIFERIAGGLNRRLGYQ